MSDTGERSWSEEEEELDMESCCSESGSVTDGPVSNAIDGVNGVLKLNEEDDEYIILKHRFYLSIGALSQQCMVVDAYRSLHSSPMEKAQVESFRIFKEAMEAKRGGDANVVHSWYGALKDEVDRIMKDGFRMCGLPEKAGTFGFGLHLCPELSARESLISAPISEDGLKHMVICRVILGSTETILPGSSQSGPSSADFDSGVDNEQAPSKYIVWYPDVKTNVLPLYAVTVKMELNSGGLQRELDATRPGSKWMPLTSLVYILLNFVPRSTLRMLRRLHTDFLERKITRQQFVFRVRQLAGDEVLVYAIRDFQNKRKNGRFEKISW
ncbi:uncharacterized protein A4U43_C10F870 [Asparagus officinalis]|uniref:Poly [ADP-ribose] polymerase n=1 Tax=Asparagus officinalis TaxID=4686 RepID=A0A5P1E419_ASPOF|nr:probable inactive poly [ADP-ribose] polymerase SRO2 [Asparagus officinalis]ONK55776.1 uncharacterized protein A4U43_C10F870 [Asparagus officinalis]